jgi:hypothetical protein
MLPIFRIISVGGVSLAISILALALLPPGGTHLLLGRQDTVARGAMMDPGQHPEWRQFMIQAALRRADELERLRSLRSDPVRLPEAALPADDAAAAVAPANQEEAVAGLQSGSHSTSSEDVTGSITDTSGATIPIDIGEASSTELPVAPLEERPPVSGVRDSRVPEPDIALPSTVPAVETRETVLPPAKPKMRVPQRRARHKKTPPPAPQAAAPQVPPPFSLIAAIFSSLGRSEPAAAANKPTAANRAIAAR